MFRKIDSVKKLHFIEKYLLGEGHYASQYIIMYSFFSNRGQAELYFTIILHVTFLQSFLHSIALSHARTLSENC